MTEPWYKRAKRRMKELNIPQRELMKPLGVKTRGAVGHYLSGRREPSGAQLDAIAVKLKWTTDQLLRGDKAYTPLPIQVQEPATGDLGLKRLSQLIELWAKLSQKHQEDLIERAEIAVAAHQRATHAAKVSRGH